MDGDKISFDEILQAVEPCLVESIKYHGSKTKAEGAQYSDFCDAMIGRLFKINRQKTIDFLVNLYANGNASDIQYGVIHLVSLFAQEHDECEQQIDKLIGLGISSNDTGLEEMACEIAESVRSKGALELLLEYRCKLENENREWMLKYVDEIISELKSEL